MLRTILTLVCAAGLLAAVAPRDTDAAILAPPAAALLAGQDGVARVSFWAHPYPYGYTGWHRCHRVRVETPYGWYWQRLCDEPGVILRRAY